MKPQLSIDPNDSLPANPLQAFRENAELDRHRENLILLARLYGTEEEIRNATLYWETRHMFYFGPKFPMSSEMKEKIKSYYPALKNRDANKYKQLKRIKAGYQKLTQAIAQQVTHCGI